MKTNKIILLFAIILCIFLGLIFISNSEFQKYEKNTELYFQDNFSNYLGNQIKIFDSYEFSNQIMIDSTLNFAEDSFFSSWVYIDNGNDIKSIDLLYDDYICRGPINLILSEPNLIKSDDEYNDYIFNVSQRIKKWEDFQLVDGINYYFWHNCTKTNNSIENNKIMFKVNYYQGNSRINITNFRVQKGVFRYVNPTNGVWYAPHGMPMYGVFDINNDGIKLLNVRQTQYPSNGDHVRILSNLSLPENFSLKVVFRLEDFGDNFNNTYFRIQYDFDNEYDPGHDWFGLFWSFEYSKIGLVTVYPIERYFKQGEEPTKFDKNSRIDLKPKEGTYELNMFIEGQELRAILYRKTFFGYVKKAELNYMFDRKRNLVGDPLSIESTGNAHLTIQDVEVRKI